MIRRLRSLVGRLRTVAPPAAAPVAAPLPTLEPELAALGTTAAAWVAARRAEGGRLYANLTPARLSQLRQECPEQAGATIAAAERVLRHEFDLLGSGPYRPVDPGRRARGGYQPIDWYLDPVSGLRFPERVPYQAWNLMEMRPGLADVKLPWELGRSQHWLPLAQACQLTGDARFAIEILDQHDDFVEANPAGFGINWTCTMDVALRAFNWALAAELIQHHTAVSGDRLARVYASLFELGGFIEHNLENKYEVTSNHFLSNVVGLYALGVVFRGVPSGERWLGLCRAWLEQEMRVQVLEDGADYESSVPYHRLVAELFLSGWRLAECEGATLSADYRRKLIAMIEFLHAVLRPDGGLPQVGDADDGRVHVFSAYGTWQPQDARHLLAPAAAIFDTPAWLEPSDSWARWESAWWGVDRPRADAPRSRDAARLFADAGIAAVRHGDTYLLVTNGRVGTNGFGNHKHNDLLGFEFHAAGVPLCVDPGSYVYTSNPDARNQFRSTAYHNTLRIDDVEQNDLRPEFLFRLFETSAVEHLGFVDTPEYAEYRGRHTGYERLPSPVAHQRSFRLAKRDGTLQIVDRLHGAGAHTIAWHFHFAPGVEVQAGAPGTWTLVTRSGRWTFSADPGLRAQLSAAWYSPSYGVRVPCRALDLTASVDLSGDRRDEFTIRPESQPS